MRWILDVETVLRSNVRLEECSMRLGQAASNRERTASELNTLIRQKYHKQKEKQST